LFGAVVFVLVVAGGTFQLITGRYVGVGRFAASYQPTPRVVRVTGCAAIVGGLVGGLVFLAGLTGHLAAK
jgi:hypothetical protein